MWAGIVLAVLVAADPAADRQAQPPCPTQTEVDAELARVGVAGISPPEIAIVDHRMRVILRGRDGLTIGSREVEVPATCPERATVAAVLVATWTGHWPAAPKMENASDSPTKPSGNVDSREAPPPPRSPANPDRSPPVPPLVTVPAEANLRRTEYALALALAFDGNGSATGIGVEVWETLLGPLRGLLGLAATTERNQSVGTATAGYLRPALEAGLALQLGRGRLRAELGASGRLGILIFRGKDLPVTHWRNHGAAGAAAGLRLVIAGKRFSPYFFATGTYWFDQQRLTLDDDPSAVALLPRWDFGVGIGLRWAAR
jgi:hypothetical protein